jgi:hypothetical protein
LFCCGPKLLLIYPRNIDTESHHMYLLCTVGQ